MLGESISYIPTRAAAAAAANTKFVKKKSKHTQKKRRFVTIRSFCNGA